MEKINIKDLNLLVTSKEIKMPEVDWIYEAIELLIKQRIKHCKSQLDEAISKDEAFFQNHLESQIIVYKDKSGEFYGHFSVPVYNDMIEFLNHTDLAAWHINRGIVQQALRQYLQILPEDEFDCGDDLLELRKLLYNKYKKNQDDLEGALTELMLVIPN